MALPPRSSVYLSCRGVFSGANAKLRKLKSIQKLLQERQQSIRSLTIQYDINSIAAVAKYLLEARVFESTTVAQRHFPELFRVSEARASVRNASEAEAAKSEAEAVRAVAIASDGEGNAVDVNGGFLVEEVTLEELTHEVIAVEPGTPVDALLTEPVPTRLEPATRVIPSLYPTKFPYKTQHRILTTAQSILERSCFNFGTTWLPNLMSSHNWTDPEAVELTKWTKLLYKHQRDIPPAALNYESIGTLSFRDVLASTDQIRHSAVHRLHTSAKGIAHMLASAVTLTKMLRDTDATRKLEAIAGKLAESIEEAEWDTAILENKLAKTLAVLANRRAELDVLEKEAIENVLKEDRENKSTIGSTLGEWIVRPGGEIQPNTLGGLKGKCKQRESEHERLPGPSRKQGEPNGIAVGGVGRDEDDLGVAPDRWLGTKDGGGVGEEGGLWESSEEDDEGEVFLEFE
ncbi:hypothetical protein GP486_003143 [Trichoglossum hirsutum]|uniref:Uncharacterized protein n=1 Tax=Trichoglossum hirsutum TaxID=265104 RepID=A0A9P8LD55_9PEZI|nr:hypothetical protein GP486_003143 [Trichoglossum hirsutum]